MDQIRTTMTTGVLGLFVRVIILIVAVYVLWLIYNFLFSTQGLSSYSVISSITVATTYCTPAPPSSGSGTNTPTCPGQQQQTTTTGGSTTTSTATNAAQVPSSSVVDSNSQTYLVEGGEFSMTTWVYIENYTYRSGSLKHLFSIDGSDGNHTMAVFLGPYSPTLGVRVYNPNPVTSSATDTSNSNFLMGTTYTGLFNNISIPNGLLDVSTPCDVAQVDMQKWVCISVVLNGKTLDVYLDGKLARSCILPNTYKVSPTYNYTFADKCGFGGWLGNTSLYNYALNPEQIWQVYMNGPGPSYTFWQYLRSLFNPNAIGATAYPKINV